MGKTIILGILLTNRVSTSPAFQEIISKHGCSIKTRIGLHTVSDNVCSPDGVILLELYGDDEETAALEEAIKTIPGADVQKMVFNYR